jgi:hypothetical protein
MVASFGVSTSLVALLIAKAAGLKAAAPLVQKRWLSDYSVPFAAGKMLATLS